VLIKTVDENSQIVTIQSSEGILNISIWKCSCSFATSMILPCHHIFKVRQMFLQYHCTAHILVLKGGQDNFTLKYVLQEVSKHIC